MKFIFPQNYNFKNKLFGVIDYTTILINVIWDAIVFLFINIFFSSLDIKIFLFIFLASPLLFFSFSGLNGENVFYVFKYLFKFIFMQKLYLYNKK